MTVLGSLYARWRRRIEAEGHRLRLSDDVRALLALGADDTLRIAEVVCGLPGCAVVDTVFLVMRQGRRIEAMKISRRMADIKRPDLETAVTEFLKRTASIIRIDPT